MILNNNKYTSHILLYHSVFNSVPNDLQGNIHNVTPDVIYKQILWLKKYYDFVSVDDLVKNYSIGKCAVTFDDGYRSVFIEASNIFEELNTPYTVYLNTMSFYGNVFWRDKIRYIINNDLIDDFLIFSKLLSFKYKIEKENFFWTTKSPQIPSDIVNKEIDSFFKTKGITMSNNYLVNDFEILKNRPQLTIGNHSENHFILSSLSIKQQENEIVNTHNKINSVGVPISKLFSLPNGLNVDFNDYTIQKLKQLEYRGILLSQNRTNYFKLKTDANDFIYAHRFLIPDSLHDLIKSISQMDKKYVKWNLRRFLKPEKF